MPVFIYGEWREMMGIILWNAWMDPKKKKKKSKCPPGAVLGRLLGEGAAYVTSGQKWNTSLNPGGYALVGM